jgi:putative ABC transport system permease protein
VTAAGPRATPGRLRRWLGLFRLGAREIRTRPRFSAFFAFNLALGLSGFIALDALEASVAAELRSRSKAFHGGDVSVESNQPFDPAVLSRLDAAAGPQAVVLATSELFSMAAGSERARLVQLRAVGAGFPLYGQIELEESGLVDSAATRRLSEETGVWIDPLLRSQLGLSIGDEVKLGETRFEVLDSVERDGTRATSGLALAPRITLSLDHMVGTGLIATGSRIEYQRLYRLPAGVASLPAAERMRAGLGPELRVRTHEEATRDAARAYTAVNDYLGLVSLIAVFLAGLGASHLFHAFLAQRLRDIAILMSLGASRREAQVVFGTQLGLLALGGALGAWLLAALLLPGAALLAGELLPGGAPAVVGLRSLGTGIALAVAASGAACLPLVARIRRLQPSDLFREHPRTGTPPGRRELLRLIPALLLFWALSIWRAGDLAIGSLFAGIFAAALVLLGVAGHVGLRPLGWLAERLRPAPAALLSERARLVARSRLAVRLALRELARSASAAVSTFVAIALATLLVSLAPQLGAVLDPQIESPDSAVIPSLFLFDIQPEQVGPLTAHVAERGVELQRVSPLVRAKLDRIESLSGDGEGGLRLGPSREKQRLLERRYNLTYRPGLNPGEKVVLGRPFSGPYRGAALGMPGALPGEMSLEESFARDLGVGIGDRLHFDVQGVPVVGTVVNTRTVAWNSFQPNFFVAFQSGLLEEAPSIFLASVPRLPEQQREALQSSIALAFPNISAVDVTRMVRRILGLLTQLKWAITSTAWLSVIVGLVLVYTIAREQARERRWETNLLKVLGADLSLIRRSLDVEFGTLGILAALFGASISLVASAVLAVFVLESEWSVAWTPLVLAAVAVPSICVLTARLASRAVLREKPLALLGDSSP